MHLAQTVGNGILDAQHGQARIAYRIIAHGTMHGEEAIGRQPLLPRHGRGVVIEVLDGLGLGARYRNEYTVGRAQPEVEPHGIAQRADHLNRTLVVGNDLKTERPRLAARVAGQAPGTGQRDGSALCPDIRHRLRRQIGCQGVRDAAAEAARRVGRDRDAGGLGIGDLERGRQADTGQARRPAREAHAGAVVGGGVPCLSKGQVAGNEIRQRTGRHALLEQGAEALLLAPDRRRFASDLVDDVVVLTADPGAVEIDCRIEARRPTPARQEVADGGRLGMDTLTDVVAVVVAGLAVLA